MNSFIAARFAGTGGAWYAPQYDLTYVGQDILRDAAVALGGGASLAGPFIAHHVQNLGVTDTETLVMAKALGTFPSAANELPQGTPFVQALVSAGFNDARPVATLVTLAAVGAAFLATYYDATRMRSASDPRPPDVVHAGPRALEGF